MPTTLPRITITAAAGGWLAHCTCGDESWHPRRPAADRAARDHQTTHVRKAVR